jgi:hypothetical protein
MTIKLKLDLIISKHGMPIPMMVRLNPFTIAQHSKQLHEATIKFSADVAALAVEDFLSWISTAQLEEGKSAVDQYKDHLFDTLLK